MKIQPYALLTFSLLLASCDQKMERRVPSKEVFSLTYNPEKPLLITATGDSVTAGVPIPAKGKKIHPDSIAKPISIPLRSSPSITPVRGVARPVYEPRKVKVPEMLTVITPGKNGVPLPEKALGRGVVQPVLHPPPVSAGKLDVEATGTASFQSMNVEQGMNNSTVRCIFNDSRGDWWFGTDKGVSRYDGSSFTHYTTDEGLAGNNVWAIFEDKRGRLWFGVNGGLTRYDGHHFTHFLTNEKIWVRTLLEDSQGNIWIGTWEHGLIRYDGEYFLYFNKGKNLLAENIGENISALYEDRQGNIWIGTWGRGAYRYDGTGFTRFATQEGLGHNSLWCISEDGRGNMWFGTSGGGAFRYDGAYFTRFSTAEGLADNAVVSILRDRRNHLWLGTWGGGVSRLSVEEVQGYYGLHIMNYDAKDGLGNNTVSCMQEDSQGRLWFGTWGGGVTRYDSDKFKHYSTTEGLSSNETRSLWEDSRGSIWIGGLGGVNRYDGAHFTHYSVTQGLIRNDVRSILEDNRRNIWFGTRIGVNRFDGNHFTAYTKHQGLNGGEYWHILQDYRGDIWFTSAQNGTCRLNLSQAKGYDDATFTHFTVAEGLLSNSIQHVMEDSRGRLWFATDRGASRYDHGGNGRFTHYHIDDELPTTGVSCIEEDKLGNFWLGTDQGVRLLMMEDTEGSQVKKHTRYTTKEGLSDNQVRSILADHQGRIWVASKKGLTLFVPTSDTSITSQGMPPNNYRLFTFGKADGLEEESFVNPVLLDSQNRIWWGTNAGVTRLDLDDFKLPTTPPQIRLSTINIQQAFIDYRRLSDTAYQYSLPFGTVLAETVDSVVRWFNYPTRITLPHDLNHLTFHFSGIDWPAPHKLSYSYFMEGLDKHWSPPNLENKADYRNIPPGHYTFKVKAIGEAQIWSDVLTYSFRIRPPWWMTWAAYTLYTCLFILILYAIQRYERSRYHALSEAQRLQELDTFKTRLYTNITHEFRTPLTIILGMAQQIRSNPARWRREGTEMITRNGRQLLSLVNQMLDLSKLDNGNLNLNMQRADVVGFLHYLIQSFEYFATEKNIQLHFLKEIDQLEMDFDPDQLTKVVSNLLSNAIKYTPEGGLVYVIVDLQSRSKKTGRSPNPEPAYLFLKVKDTGYGIPAAELPRIFDRFYQVDNSSTRKVEGAGIGLSLTKELVHLMGGEIQVQSVVSEGSTFSVRLPVKTGSKGMEREAENTEPFFPARDWTIPQSATGLGSPIFSVWPWPGEPAVEPGVDVRATHSPTPPGQSGLPTILLIEDSLDVLRYLASCLEANYQLEFARNGREGIEQALEITPDIIISDVMMPEKDGYEVCAVLKEDIRTSHIPIILLTAKADRDTMLKGLRTGADAYLTKPFDQAELEIRLQKLLELRRQLQRRYSSLNIIEKAVTEWLSKEDLFLKDLRKIVEENLSNESFSISQLCRKIGMSRSQLHNKLTALTGASASHYIRAIRLERAKELLRHTDLNISEVAYEVGFRTPLYFTQVFKEAMGLAPGLYRKNKEV